MNSNDDYKRISCFQDFVCIKNKLYFPMLSEDIICSMNSDSDELKMEYVFPRSKKNRSYAFHTCFHFEEYIILVPYVAKFIVLYHIKKKKIKIIDIPENKKNEIDYIIYGKIEDDKLYFFISNNLSILMVDISRLINDECVKNTSSEVFYRYDINPIFSIEKRYLFYFGFDYVRMGRKIYTIIKNSNYVVEFDMDTGSFKYDRHKVSFASISLYGNIILLLNEKDGIIYKYDNMSCQLTEYFSHEKLVSHNEKSVIKSIVHNGWLYLWGDFSDEVTVVNIETSKIASISLGKCMNELPFNFERIAQKTSAWKIIDDFVFFLSMAHNKIFYLKNGRCIKEYQFPPVSWGNAFDMYFSRLIDESVYQENRFVKCDRFFDIIFNGDIKKEANTNVLCSESIYNECVR